MAKRTTIADLKHRVEICSMRDPIGPNGMEIKREAIFSAWARIEPKSATTFSPEGFAIKGNRDTRTHQITTRVRHEVNISSGAWIFEERLVSSPRWFKILSVREEDAEFFVFDCRLVERSDDAEKPTEEEGCKPSLNVAKPLPDTVRL